MKKLLLFSLLSVVLASCSTRVGNFTVLSTRNMDITKYTYKISPTRVQGSDETLFFGILSSDQPCAQTAISKAMEAAGPDCVGLSDATINYKWWWIPYIHGSHSYTVEGNPILNK